MRPARARRNAAVLAAVRKAHRSDELHILGDGRARCREHIARDGCGCTGAKCRRPVLGQELAPRTKANVRRRIDEAEDRNRSEDVLARERREMFERRAWNCHERVQRDGLDAEFLQCERHVKAVLPRLPHTDDTARADAKPLRLCRLDRSNAVGIAVRRADLREITLRCLDVVMIARDTRLTQTAKLAAREQPVRGTEINGKGAAHLLIGIQSLLKLRTRERTPRGDDGKAVRTRILICLCVRDQILLCHKVIGIDTCLVPSRLCTVFAVLAASPAAPVDDRAQIDVIAAEMLLETVCPLAEILDRRIHKDGAIIFAADAIARDDLLREFCNTMFAH